MFTVDSQEQLSDNKCPMLDLKVWKEKDHGGQTVIRHTFYEKEVTSPIVFHARGAHTWRSKLVTLLEEVNRKAEEHGQEPSKERCPWSTAEVFSEND